MPRNISQEQDQISLNNHFNIIDLLTLDHSYLVECINVLKNKNADKKIKLKYAKTFLDAFKKHSAGEKKALYAPLEEVTAFRSTILEYEIEHAIVDSKVKILTSKLASIRSMSEELEAEMTVLAAIVEHHIGEEEKVLFPKMRQDIENKLLNEMGFQFMVIRQFSEKDLQHKPELKEEVSFIKNSSPISSAKYLSRTHKYFSSQQSLR
ncbi:MAG: hemerythrin domain-containing protein [Bacteriovorax sp.]|nr:hemerythrin domain-containing protein [Bacteriovorax sp.]